MKTLRIAPILLLLFGLSACPADTLPSDDKAPQAIAWVSTVASPRPVYAQPSGEARRCTNADVRVTVTLEGATGSAAGAIGFLNRSREGCSLAGRPSVRILDRHGQEIAIEREAGEADFEAGIEPPGWPTVFLRPGDHANAMTVMTQWCSPRMPERWIVSLPSLAEPVSVVQRATARCDGTISSSSRPTLSIAQVIPFPLPVERQPLPFTVRIDAPASVVAWEPLRYSVTLTNTSATAFTFASCPEYVEELGGEGIKAFGRFVINCVPAGSIPAGASVTFRMVLEDWFAARDGAATLSWSLDGLDIAPARARITVRAA